MQLAADITAILFWGAFIFMVLYGFTYGFISERRHRHLAPPHFWAVPPTHVHVLEDRPYDWEVDGI